jgi:hypothetical protein
LPLRQTGADEQRQTPQALRLCSSSPASWVSLKMYLELTLKLFVKVRVMLRSTQ